MTGKHDPSTAGISELEKTTMKRVFWRIMPFIAFAYFISYIDRVNIGVAALQMNTVLHIDAAQYGFAAGIFFISYCVLEVPSNMLLVRFGARRWLARIMISWGLVGILMAFVTGPYSLYLVRLLLGAAEAGLYPGAIFYLSLWFPARYRARMIAIFGVAVPISNFVGSPISAALLDIGGVFGLQGWQWLFILESVPAILFGFLFWAVMCDGPATATWLTPAQRDWLIADLASEQKKSRPVGILSTWRVLGNPYVLGLALVYAGSAGATVGLGLWMPQILKSFGVSNTAAALLNMVPFGVASVVMVWWGLGSDKAGERLWRTSLPLMITGISLAATLLTPSLVPTLILLTFALVGTYALKGPFWALVSDWVPVMGAAAAIAQINALSNLAGFGVTYLIGYLKNSTGSFAVACLPLVVLAALATAVLLLLGVSRQRATASPAV